ncbi:complement C2-like isoform X1 [Bufo gargarizans]|uniref:complement C2-like isoform X1 n=1 Tax=Bufo gargarizans TaxID=30331 RepID=UPI001CF3B750|nr:complement C2-like isoform X1 [Bufo gargarizans]
MGHRRQAEYLSLGGLLQVFLLLGFLFVAACEPEIQCSQDFGTKTATVVLTDGLNMGSTARFLCSSGYYPWPQSSRMCQAHGRWTDIRSSSGKKIKEISCKKIKCPNPTTFENGDFSPKGPFYVDSNITFMCNDGYIPRGSMVRTCMENGKWSGDTAICDDGVGHCPDPGLPPGAMKTGVRYDVGSSVSYRCDSNLILIGSSKRTCLESRRWSGTEVTCQYPYTFDLPEEAGEYFAGSLSGILKTSEKKLSAGRTVKIRKDGILNVYILLDASKSVGENTFNIFKTCAEILVSKLGDFDMKIEFAVISFATQPKIIVSISNSDDSEDVVERIEEGLKYSDHKDKSGTNTYAALEEVQKMMSLQEELYKNATVWNSIHHVIVLLTDGKANMGGRPALMIKKIRNYLNIEDKREDYLDVYAFGVSGDADKTELTELASQKEDEKHVFVLETAEDMITTFQKIIDIKDYGEMCGLNEETSESKKSFHHPWNVKIKAHSTSPCFGSLISSSWVLSAAHCFSNFDTSDKYTFYIGEEQYKAEQIFIHDCFNMSRKVGRGLPQDFDYDVALVKLTTKVKFSKSARPICLPCTEPANRAMKKKKNASCNEHRSLLLGGSDVPAAFLSKEAPKKDDLKELSVNIKINNLREACIAAIRDFDKYKNIALHDMVSPRHLCAQGDMSCKGESGGSLFMDIPNRKRYFQVGVLSFGTYNPCSSAQRKTSYPSYARDFYTDVLEVLPWLQKHLKEELQFQPGVKEYKEVVCPT